MRINFVKGLLRKSSENAILNKMRTEWDDRAKENARHYVATLRDNWTDADFFESGAGEVRQHIESRLSEICGARAPSELNMLEIGCGAGRMTMPLSKIFGHVDAVDISPEMIARAKIALRDCRNVRFHVNNGKDLAMFKNDEFDFAFSGIVFQHIPSRAIVENYIQETWRVLRSGAFFVFQVQGHSIPESTLNTWVGVGFRRDEMVDIAHRNRFAIREMTGEGTQYFWLAFTKP
jgi:SAM-dependent methyltransferase